VETPDTHRLKPWLVWPDSRQPHLRREGYLPRAPFHQFRTFGEAWEHLILRWAHHYDKYDPNQTPNP